MSNLEPRPALLVCHSGPTAGDVEVLAPRLVPLGGPRAMSVRRTLPARGRRLIGAWCFLDHYGPADTGVVGMDVRPHPHIGLQTVTWIFGGTIAHRDSLGSVQEVGPGQLSLMTAGRGIAHSERSVPRVGSSTLRGVQLWVALPEPHRGVPASYEFLAAPPAVVVQGAGMVVLIGSLAGVSSPARTYSPLLAAQIDLPADGALDLALDPGFEHAILVDDGAVHLDGTAVPERHLGLLGEGADRLDVRPIGSRPARLMLIGGAPLYEEIVMWWNFVGRSHEDIVEARTAWQRLVADGGGPEESSSGTVGFADVPDDPGAPLPAPEIPGGRLLPRPGRG